MRLPRALLSVAVAVAALGLLPAGVGHAADKTIVATNANTFVPATVTIALGDTVTWTWATDNNLKEHTVTSTSANWDINAPLSVAPTERSATFTFEEFGTYSFVCSVHGAAMSGQVRVPAPKPTPKPTPRPTTASPRPTSASPRPTSSSTTAQPEPTETQTAGTPPLGGVESTAPSSAPSRSGVPTPSVAPLPSQSPPDTVTIGGPGLTPPPGTGRERGVWVMLACVALLGVGSAQLRTLLVVPVGPDR